MIKFFISIPTMGCFHSAQVADATLTFCKRCPDPHVSEVRCANCEVLLRIFYESSVECRDPRAFAFTARIARLPTNITESEIFETWEQAKKMFPNIVIPTFDQI